MTDDEKLKPTSNGVVAIWRLLSTNNRFYRAAAILLLEEYASTLTAQGHGDLASRMVQQFRDDDPRKKFRPKGKENRLVP